MNAVIQALTWTKPTNPDSVVKPMVLTHGTAESYNLAKTRDFYENFLGLSCVRIAPEGLVAALGVQFHIVVLETGEALRPQGLVNHWGMQVKTREEVDEAYKKTIELKENYGIREIMPPVEQSWGAYSFFFEDLDHNWWEIEYYGGNLTDDFFAFGDIV